MGSLFIQSFVINLLFCVFIAYDKQSVCWLIKAVYQEREFLLFFSFLMSDDNLLPQWMSTAGIDSVGKRLRLCSAHFSSDSFLPVGQIEIIFIAYL
jgi:hypothetical protein